MSNIACRIYKEQMEMLLSLPNQEEAKNILYQALISSYNQFENKKDNQNENQFDNQIENQNEYPYVSISLSILNINILKLLIKNIVWKEFSNNYGGKRIGAGKPKKEKKKESSQKREKFIPPTLDEIKEYAKEKNRSDLVEKFWDYYNTTGWVDSNGKKVANWKGKFVTWAGHTSAPKNDNYNYSSDVDAFVAQWERSRK